MDIKLQFEKTKQILQGLELVFPTETNISKTIKFLRFFTTPEKQTDPLFIIETLELLSSHFSRPLAFSPEELKSLIFEKNALTSVMKIVKRLAKSNESNQVINSFRKMCVHFIEHGDDKYVFRYLYDVTQIRLINNIAAVRNKVCLPDFEDFFSKGQIASKLWLVKEIKKLEVTYSDIQLLCGWYALSAYLLSEPGLKINSYDLDHTATRVANIINQDTPNFSETFTAKVQDIYTITDLSKSSLIINTSCEHLSDFQRWYGSIQSGTLLALQSNDFFDCDQHLNCVASLEDFRRSAPMSEVLYSGELNLPQYTRFMIIGIK